MSLEANILDDFPVGTDVILGADSERLITRGDYSIDEAVEYLKGKKIVVIGYGPQGSSQALNLQMNGLDVIIAQRETYVNDEGRTVKSKSFKRALKQGWVKGENLLPIAEAVREADITMFLASDAGQADLWETVRDNLKEGSTLNFAHGFAIHFHEQTGIVPPDYVNVTMVAPKGVGDSVRTRYLKGSGINSAIAVHQDYTGDALNIAVALGIAIGSPILNGTTFRTEVISDHFGERMCLLGHIWALAEAMYETSRERGLTPEKAFTYSSEQLTQVLLPLIGRSGCEEIYAQAEAVGELGTVLKYEREFYDRLGPIADSLYEEVSTGREAARALAANSDPDYRIKLEAAFKAIDESEMWTVGRKIRIDYKKCHTGMNKFSPNVPERDYGHKITNYALAGALLGSMKRQYDTLIKNGHRPGEAGNETHEESTMSLNPLNQANGIAHLVTHCSTTAQRGTLDWGPDFRKISATAFRELKPSYENETVPQGHNISPMWKTVGSLRDYRPENVDKLAAQ